MTRIATAVAALAVAAVMALPASATGPILVGVGTGSFQQEWCPPQNFQIVMEGAELPGGDEWAFNMTIVNNMPLCAVEADFPLLAITVPAVGPWSPAGGCLPTGTGPLVSYLCLLDPDENNGIVTYDIYWCDDPEPCSDSGRIEFISLPG